MFLLSTYDRYVNGFNALEQELVLDATHRILTLLGQGSARAAYPQQC